MKRSQSYESYLNKHGQLDQYSIPKPVEDVYTLEKPAPGPSRRGPPAREANYQTAPRADPEACLFVANLSIDKSYAQLKNSLMTWSSKYG